MFPDSCTISRSNSLATVTSNADMPSSSWENPETARFITADFGTDTELSFFGNIHGGALL
jgi:hypothetical protein